MVLSILESGAFSVLILTLLTTFFSDNEIDVPNISEPLTEYDYIIVGSGAAGSTVAAKLARGSSVLLVEAGGLPSTVTKIPSLFSIQMRSELDWSFLTEPEENVAFGYENRQYIITQGKSVGGSPAINGMLFYWPSVNDMENWATITGDQRFRFQNAIQHFKAIENATAVVNRSPDRGLDGPIRLTSFRCESSVLCMAFLEAGRFHGHSVTDVNSQNQYGFMPPQRNIVNGKRWSTLDAFLLPTLNDERGQLNLLINSLVEKVEFSNNRATGVTIRIRNQRSVTVRARNEVILAAGAFNTPKLLLLSGIGPREHLQQLQIPVVKDLPVGQHLLNHLSLIMSYRMNENVTSPRSRFFAPDVWRTYFRNNTGPASENGLFAMARLPRPSGKPGDILYSFIGAGFMDSHLRQYTSNLKLTAIHQMIPYANNLSSPVMFLEPMLLHPRSEGVVTLRSTDPRDPPRIKFNLLSERDDEDFFLESIRLGDQLMRSPSLQNLGFQLHLPDIPECRPAAVPLWRPSLNSDSYLRCWIRYSVRSNAHPVGTCKMGPKSDPGTVVDTRFRILGISGLRVVDASVFPTHMACNTQGPVFAVANMAADTILDDNE